MIPGDKSMIEGCIEKMRGGGCGGCDREEACAALMRRFWSPTSARATRRPRGMAPFLAFLGEVAKAFDKPARRPPSDFVRRVEAEIESLLADGGARVDAVAASLGLSRQTLYRRLKAEQVTFEGLMERVRRRLALRFVRDEGLSVKEAAWRLGFAEPAAFSRAFKRWTGKSPRDTRRRAARQTG